MIKESLLLSLTWLIPALTAVITLAFPPDANRGVKRLNVVSCLLNLGLVVYLLFRYQAVAAVSIPLAFTMDLPWFSVLNIRYTIGVDALSILMMLLTAIVSLTGVLASWNINTQVREFFILANILVAGVFGVFISFDLFVLFLFYEVAVLPMYLLIGVWGTGRKEYAAMKLTLMLVAGSALIFGGILALYFGSGISSFNIFQLADIRFDPVFQRWAFTALFVGFGVLSALFPFHTWSPDGHASAPTAVSMLHAGVLMKLGGYGCLRVAMFILPEGAREILPYLLVPITINVAYGAFVAVRQTDLKYINAYSSVSHLGLVLMGLAVMTYTGLKGSAMQMISHGLLTALMFCLIGMIYGRTHTREVPEMGGLMKVMPFLGVAFVIAGFAGLGLPGLSGFAAEVTLFIGVFENPSMIARIAAVLAILSITTTAVYILRATNRMLHGPISEEFAKLGDATTMEKIPVVILVACLFGMGIFPGWIANLLDYSIQPIMENLTR